MDIDDLALMATLFSLVILTTFTGLIWAAVQDGREESRVRASHGTAA